MGSPWFGPLANVLNVRLVIISYGCEPAWVVGVPSALVSVLLKPVIEVPLGHCRRRPRQGEERHGADERQQGGPHVQPNGSRRLIDART